jgi:hypothetical protein
MLDELYCSVRKEMSCSFIAPESCFHLFSIDIHLPTQLELSIGTVRQPATLSRRLVTESTFVSFLFPQPRNQNDIFYFLRPLLHG